MSERLRDRLAGIGFFFVVFGFISALGALIVGSAKDADGTLPIKETREVSVRKLIEKEIEVAALQNRFIYTTFFGAAGGMGSSEVRPWTVQQFVELVQKDEPIYVAFEKSKYQVRKIYWAFMKDRAGLFICNDIYEAGWKFRVRSFTPEKICFCRYDASAYQIWGLGSFLSIYFPGIFLAGIGGAFQKEKTTTSRDSARALA